MAKGMAMSKKKNKKMVYAVVVIAALGLVLTSALGYFGFRSFYLSPSDGIFSGTEEAIADLEYRISQYEDSLARVPDNLNLLVILGNSYYQLGLAYSDINNQAAAAESFAKALEPYGRALEIDPGNVDVRVDRAVAAFWSNNYDEAEREFQTAVEMDPNHAKAHFNYGIFLYLGRNRPAEAISQWQEVVELNPADDPQLVATARMWIAQVEEELRNPNFQTTPQN